MQDQVVVNQVGGAISVSCRPNTGRAKPGTCRTITARKDKIRWTELSQGGQNQLVVDLTQEGQNHVNVELSQGGQYQVQCSFRPITGRAKSGSCKTITGSAKSGG